MYSIAAESIARLFAHIWHLRSQVANILTLYFYVPLAPIKPEEPRGRVTESQFQSELCIELNLLADLSRLIVTVAE
jgi:hypothetical protein